MSYDEKKLWTFTVLSETFGETPIEKVETAIVVMDRKLAESQLLLKNCQYIDSLTNYAVINDLATEARSICRWQIPNKKSSDKCLKLVMDELRFVDDELETLFKQACDGITPSMFKTKSKDNRDKNDK